MTTYPNITGTYSDAAWDRAALFTDGRITESMLRAFDGIETPVDHAAVLKFRRGCVRTAIYHYRQVVGRWDARTVANRLKVVQSALEQYRRAQAAAREAV